MAKNDQITCIRMRFQVKIAKKQKNLLHKKETDGIKGHLFLQETGTEDEEGKETWRYPDQKKFSG
jgi:hypothetical protein